MKKLTQNRPVTAFVIYAFCITWILGVIMAVALGPLEAQMGWQNQPVSMILLKFGPSVAGVLTAWLISGKDGLLRLLKRGIKWQVPLKVILVAIVVPAACLLTPLFIFAPQYIPEIFVWQTLPILVSTAAIKIFLGGGFGEEFGWRGFMQPQLENKYSPLAASMIVGIVWIVWHLPAVFLGQGIGNPVIFFVTILSYSVILAWIYHNSGGSVLWAAIFHGWANALSNTLNQVVGEQTADIEFFINASYAICITLVALTILFFYGRQLAKKLDIFIKENQYA